jgi:hypothetical protein
MGALVPHSGGRSLSHGGALTSHNGGGGALTTGDHVGISIDGVNALANLFDEMARASGRYSLDAAMQEACTTFAKDTLLPAVQANAPKDTGAMAGEADAWPVERNMPGGEAAVGYVFGAYTDDYYYAVHQEFGWQQGIRRGGKLGIAQRPQIPPDKFLRRTLYAHETRFKRHVMNHFFAWVRRTNRL